MADFREGGEGPAGDGLCSGDGHDEFGVAVEGEHGGEEVFGEVGGFWRGGLKGWEGGVLFADLGVEGVVAGLGGGLVDDGDLAVVGGLPPDDDSGLCAGFGERLAFYPEGGRFAGPLVAPSVDGEEGAGLFAGEEGFEAVDGGLDFVWVVEVGDVVAEDAGEVSRASFSLEEGFDDGEGGFDLGVGGFGFVREGLFVCEADGDGFGGEHRERALDDGAGGDFDDFFDKGEGLVEGYFGVGAVFDGGCDGVDGGGVFGVGGEECFDVFESGIDLLVGGGEVRVEDSLDGVGEVFLGRWSEGEDGKGGGSGDDGGGESKCSAAVHAGVTARHVWRFSWGTVGAGMGSPVRGWSVDCDYVDWDFSVSVAGERGGFGLWAGERGEGAVEVGFGGVEGFGGGCADGDRGAGGADGGFDRDAAAS